MPDCLRMSKTFGASDAKHGEVTEYSFLANMVLNNKEFWPQKVSDPTKEQLEQVEKEVLLAAENL